MADGTGYGAFHDSDQDLAVMQRYEAFLQLQLDADGLTDEEYLERLDRISGGDPSELMRGAEAYGSDDAEMQQAAAAVRTAEELAEEEGYGQADGTVYPEGMLRREDAAYQEDTGYGPPSEDTGGYGEGEDAARHGDAEEYGDSVDHENDSGQREDDAEESETDAADMFLLGAMAADGRTQAAIDDESEAEKEEDGPELSAGAVRSIDDDVPVGPTIVLDDEDEPGKEQPEAVPAGAYPGHEQLIPEGELVARKEYQVEDILDSVALGTGTLSGAVVGYEYIPARPPILAPEPKQMTPALAAMYREMQRTDEREMERQLSGPSR